MIVIICTRWANSYFLFAYQHLNFLCLLCIFILPGKLFLGRSSAISACQIEYKLCHSPAIEQCCPPSLYLLANLSGSVVLTHLSAAPPPASSSFLPMLPGQFLFYIIFQCRSSLGLSSRLPALHSLLLLLRRS